MGGNFLARLKRTYETSETKCVGLMLIWGLGAWLAPQFIPRTLPPIDLSEVGMGIMTFSIASLGVYALGRCLIKVFKKGSFPFLPDPEEV